MRGCRPGFRDLLAGCGQLGRRPPDGRADVVGQGWTSGSTPRTVKVAASTTPAEVITPPVTADTRRDPGAGAEVHRLRTRGHQDEYCRRCPGRRGNTKANNGNGPGHRPANPDRWVNAHPHTRRVAATENTTLTISSARSSRVSTGQHGSAREDDDRDDQVPVVHRGVARVSSVAADCPPTSADRVHRWCGAGRSCRTPPRQVDAGPD